MVRNIKEYNDNFKQRKLKDQFWSFFMHLSLMHNILMYICVSLTNNI
jgi:hypothetical protein